MGAPKGACDVRVCDVRQIIHCRDTGSDNSVGTANAFVVRAIQRITPNANMLLCAHLAGLGAFVLLEQITHHPQPTSVAETLCPTAAQNVIEGR